jgi:hypothetical protein
MKIMLRDLNAADYCNYRGVSLLSTAYKIVSNILLSRLTLHAEEIIWDYRCGFRRNSSTIDHIIYILNTGKKIRIQRSSAPDIYIDLEKAYDLFRRAVGYNIRNEFDIPMKQVRLIIKCVSVRSVAESG